MSLVFSDGLNKIHYASLTKLSVLDSEKELCICVTPDKENKLLKIQDIGIGTRKADMVNNLGNTMQADADMAKRRWKYVDL
jgi:HSP90 family molecular chaperone